MHITKNFIARFDAAVPAQWEDYVAPTAESIAALEARFDFRIPKLLLEFALMSKSFSSFFLSFGPDYSSHSHVISKNDFIRRDSDWLAFGACAPVNLVFITENFMDDHFWCLDVSQAGIEYPVVLWRAGDSAKATTARHPDFEDFIFIQIANYESKRRQ